jgi:hypothetical protein
MLVQREVRWVFLARSLNSKAGAVPLKTQWGEGAYGFSPLEIVGGGGSETTNSFPHLRMLSKPLVSAWKVTSEKNLVICSIVRRVVILSSAKDLNVNTAEDVVMRCFDAETPPHLSVTRPQCVPNLGTMR